ncbi:hypothetical protein JZ751_026582 [Albula glossodonta]|uniref:Uncharacterized protein n=1 Tax=Albula glossodonta TaxID=121402 RepID=A0A8T2PDE4_9TELE|nr:hypothetical protein JZ751_026582 [Albula glossodonta]
MFSSTPDVLLQWLFWRTGQKTQLPLSRTCQLLNRLSDGHGQPCLAKPPPPPPLTPRP